VTTQASTSSEWRVGATISQDSAAHEKQEKTAPGLLRGPLVAEQVMVVALAVHLAAPQRLLRARPRFVRVPLQPRRSLVHHPRRRHHLAYKSESKECESLRISASRGAHARPFRGARRVLLFLLRLFVLFLLALPSVSSAPSVQKEGMGRRRGGPTHVGAFCRHRLQLRLQSLQHEIPVRQLPPPPPLLRASLSL
jgi:hypothetical protein